MQLEGVGSSTAIRFSNKDVEGQIETNENKIDEEEMEIQSQAREVEETKYSEDEVIDIIEEANNKFIAYDRKFEYSIHEKTKQVMIKVLDSVTNEVIRELPPEKVIDIIAGIMEVAGLIVDKKI